MTFLPDPKPRKTHCKRGHEFTPENTYVHSDGRRECRVCSRARQRGYEQRLLERGLRPNKGTWKRKDPAPYACAECGRTRMLRSKPKTGLCGSCAMKAAIGTGADKTCPCGQVFYVKHARIGRAKYCSIACRREYGGYEELAKAMSVDRRSAGNPGYRHGRRAGVNIPGWRLRNKGESRCRNCQSSEFVELHHAIPRGKWKGGREDLRNALPLCRTCHLGWHHKKVTIYQDVFTEDEWEFLCNANLTGQLVGDWLERNYPVRGLGVAA